MIYFLLSDADLGPIYIPFQFSRCFERCMIVRLYISGCPTINLFHVNRQFSTELRLTILDNAELRLTIFDPFKDYSSKRLIFSNFPDVILQRFKHCKITAEVPGNAEIYVGTIGKYDWVIKTLDGVKILTKAVLNITRRLGCLRTLQIDLYQSLEKSIGNPESSLLLKTIRDLHSLSGCAVNMKVIEPVSAEFDWSDESDAEEFDWTDESDAEESDESVAEESDESIAEESDGSNADESDESSAEKYDESGELDSEGYGKSGAEEDESDTVDASQA